MRINNSLRKFKIEIRLKYKCAREDPCSNYFTFLE